MISASSIPMPLLEIPIESSNSPLVGDLEVVVDQGFQNHLTMRHIDIVSGGSIERRDIGATFGACFFGMLLSLGVIAKTGQFDHHIGHTGGVVISVISFVAMMAIGLLVITCYLKHEPVEEMSNNYIPPNQEELSAAQREYLEIKAYEMTFLKAMIGPYVEMKAKSAMQHLRSSQPTENACQMHLLQYLEKQLEVLIQSSKGTESVYRSNAITDPTTELFYWDDFVRHSMASLFEKRVPQEAYSAAKVIWDFNGE